jgi:integrase
MNEVGAIKDKKQIERMKKSFTNDRDLLLFTLGINTGLRISDLLGLRVKDVAGQAIKLKEIKTGKVRTITLDDVACKAVKAYLGNESLKDNDFIFYSRKGENQPISRVQAWTILNQAANKAKLDINIGTHTLRKTFGYWAYKQGIDITLLQQVFNHSAPSITLRYIGITQDDIKNVYINLNL